MSPEFQIVVNENTVTLSHYVNGNVISVYENARFINGINGRVIIAEKAKSLEYSSDIKKFVSFDSSHVVVFYNNSL